MDIDAPISVTLTDQSCTLTHLIFSQDMTHPKHTFPGGPMVRHTIDKCINSISDFSAKIFLKLYRTYDWNCQGAVKQQQTNKQS